MATWGELQVFTWGELEEMELTYGQLETLTFPELVRIAQEKLERFKQLPDDWTPTAEQIVRFQKIYEVAKSAKIIDEPKISDIDKFFRTVSILALVKILEQILEQIEPGIPQSVYIVLRIILFVAACL